MDLLTPHHLYLTHAVDIHNCQLAETGLIEFILDNFHVSASGINKNFIVRIGRQFAAGYKTEMITKKMINFNEKQLKTRHSSWKIILQH